MNHFYALMKDNTVKYINLSEDIVDEVKDIFLQGGKELKPEGIEEDKFDGNMISRDGENIMYVEYNLPEDFNRIPNNQADISIFDIADDIPKSIFYYDESKFYFQVFNKKNLLKRKMILRMKEYGNEFEKMDDSAFIIGNNVHLIFENGRLYFQNYTVANQIFSLTDYVVEATAEEIKSFEKTEGIDVSADAITNVANVKTRRLIKSLSNTENIAVFMRKSTKVKKGLLDSYGVKAKINSNNELELPTDNVAELNRALQFLNEDMFKGIITDGMYISNSKKSYQLK